MTGVANVLVSGNAGQVQEVSDALTRQGATVTPVTDLADVPAVCDKAGPGAFDAYVQLGATFQVQGATAIERVRHFYADGVLARFTALDAALPALARDARLVFVLGVLPKDAATQDDRDARQALTRVLAHAARADHADGRLVVHMLDTGSPAAEIAQVTLGQDANQQVVVELSADLSYADWRVEVMGLMAMET